MPTKYSYCHSCHKKVKLYKTNIQPLIALELVYYEFKCEQCDQLVLTDTERMLTTAELKIDTSNRDAMLMKPNLWALMDY